MSRVTIEALDADTEGQRGDELLQPFGSELVAERLDGGGEIAEPVSGADGQLARLRGDGGDEGLQSLAERRLVTR